MDDDSNKRIEPTLGPPLTPAEFAVIRPATAADRAPMSTGNKLTSWLVVALLLAGGYYLVSPYVAVELMRSAGQEGDYATVNEYVDYPALRENFKGQFKAGLVKEMAKGKSDVGTGLALAFGPMFIDHMVDSFVTPEGVASMLEGADAEEAKETKKGDAKPDNGPRTVSQGYAGGLDRFVVRIERDDVKTSMVFRRSGFATWRLTAVDLPDEAFK